MNLRINTNSLEIEIAQFFIAQYIYIIKNSVYLRDTFSISQKDILRAEKFRKRLLEELFKELKIHSNQTVIISNKKVIENIQFNLN